MKANELPDKIYLFDNPITETPDDRWLSKRSDDEDFEYVRTDAFIEKAVEWWMDNFVYTDDVDIKYKTIEDFKNYMKGE